jgi:hypothetical protein
MTEQHAPRVAEPVVKLDLALCGLGGEVWGNISETNWHDLLLDLVAQSGNLLWGGQHIGNPTKLVNFEKCQFQKLL